VRHSDRFTQHAQSLAIAIPRDKWMLSLTSIYKIPLADPRQMGVAGHLWSGIAQ
jgi:hypothetical protein